MSGPDQHTPDPKRFEVSGKTLFFDRFMGWFIRFGGIAVILAVIGMFFFIAKVAVPLFKSPDVEPSGKIEAGIVPPVIGVDERGEMPFIYEGGSKVTFLNFSDDKTKDLVIPGLEDATITAYAFDTVKQRLVYGLEDGRVGSFLVDYERVYNEDASESWL